MPQAIRVRMSSTVNKLVKAQPLSGCCLALICTAVATLPRRPVVFVVLLLRKLSLMLPVVALLWAPAFAQEKNPQRGFQPGNSYNFSEIETINTTNGNLLLNFLLGSMPAGRGSLPGVVSVRLQRQTL